MRKMRKLTAMLLAGIMSLSVLAGCGGKDAGSPDASASSTGTDTGTENGLTYNGQDVSEPVELVMYYIGDKTEDEDLILTEINKILKEKINATLVLKNMSLSDYSTKYALTIAGGENFDLIYTSTWAYYQSEANKGAFAEVTEPVLNDYMPLHKENQADASWGQAKIGGKVYFVPCNMANVSANAILIRGDLREKYGLDRLQTEDDLENYYAGSDVTEVTIEEAKSILENKIERTVITCDGEKLTKQEKIKNKTYLLGTDGLGRDLFIRIVYGARISLLVGLFAAFINFVVGVFYGAIAGYCGGTVDNIMMRIIDVLDSIPMTLYVILIMVVVGPGISSIIIALGLTFWVKMARIVRGQVLTLKQQEFVKAAIVTGADTKRIIVKHLIPNMMGPIMVNMAMQIPSAIFNEAFLSFVGLGISAPMASWGTLCNDALAGIYVYPYQMVYPAIAISVTILTFNLLSDGLRDAFDPKQRK